MIVIIFRISPDWLQLRAWEPDEPTTRSWVLTSWIQPDHADDRFKTFIHHKEQENDDDDDAPMMNRLIISTWWVSLLMDLYLDMTIMIIVIIVTIMTIMIIMIIVMWSLSRPDVCLCSWIPLSWTGSVASFQPWIRIRIIVMSLTHKYVEDHDNHDGDDDFHSIFALHTFILTSWIAVLMSST